MVKLQKLYQELSFCVFEVLRTLLLFLILAFLGFSSLDFPNSFVSISPTLSLIRLCFRACSFRISASYSTDSAMRFESLSSSIFIWTTASLWLMLWERNVSPPSSYLVTLSTIALLVLWWAAYILVSRYRAIWFWRSSSSYIRLDTSSIEARVSSASLVAILSAFWAILIT